MDNSTYTIDGPQSSEPAALQPWLRLAHQIGKPLMSYPNTCQLRYCDDYCLIYQLDAESWIWWQGSDNSSANQDSADINGSIMLPANHAVLLPPGSVHGLGLGSHIAVHFDLQAQPALKAMAMLHPLNEQVQQGPLTDIPLIQHDNMQWPLRIRISAKQRWKTQLNTLIELYSQHQHMQARHQPRIMSALGFIVSAFIEHKSSPNYVAENLDPRLQDLFDDVFIREGQIPSIEDLAQRVGLGVVAFRQLCHRQLGCAPRAWFEQRRIEIAVQQLLNSDAAINDIAQEVGYADPYHFSRVFKRIMGVSPRLYRQGGKH
ncbi:MAG: helix-turn-helix transcriptional regulator [Planctomycetes bacterium]|nr:helix-turn-helix transcriptional regulator [Planctomycetota bacterium]